MYKKNVQDNKGMKPLHHAVNQNKKVLLLNVDKVAKESIEVKDKNKEHK